MTNVEPKTANHDIVVIDEDDDNDRGALWWTAANRYRRPLVGGALAIVMLWLLGLATCTGPIQNDLTDRARAALDKAGYEQVDVSFSGRDATLKGFSTTSEADRAKAVVEKLEGVREVHLDLDGATSGVDADDGSRSVGTGADVDGGRGALEFTAPNTVRVRGTVKTANERDALIASAQKAAGSGVDIVDEVTIDPAAAAFGKGPVVVRATVKSDAARRGLLSLVRGSTTADVVDKVTVDPDAKDAYTVPGFGEDGTANGDGSGNAGVSSDAPSLKVGADGKWTLTGKVASAADRDRLLAAARSAAGPGVEIIDELTIDDSVGALDDRGLRLTGDVADESARAALLGSLGTAGLTTQDDLTVKSGGWSPTGSGDGSGSTNGATTTTVADPEATAKAEAVERDISALLEGRVIEFATGSAVLTPAGSAVVDEIAPLLNEAPSSKVEIQGHTDNTGNAASNQALSQARAETVKKALTDRGVAADRLTAVGFGGDRPKADNNTAEGRQHNRRIEFDLS